MGNQSGRPAPNSTAGRPKKNVHWKSADPPSAPGKPILVHGDAATGADSSTATDSDSVVTLKWDRPHTDGGSALYGYYVEHRRTGSPQWVNSTPALILYPEVVLTGLEPGWRYQFRVSAENAVGTSPYSDLSDPLTVSLQRNVAASAPRFLDELAVRTTAIENDKVEFRVTWSAHPAAQVNWFKDGFEVFSSRRTRIVTENNASTLTIHQTALTDEGEIKCTATNRLGHCVSRGALCIEAPPKIRLPRQYEDGLLIEADEVVRLKVGLAGRPAPMVVWCHNGEMIKNEPGGHYDVQTTEKNSTLKIASSRRADRGEYNLRAINKLGEDLVSFLVTVTDRPSRPGKVTVSMSLGKSVTLAWQPPDDDGGCKIGNYVVEYFRLGWNVWLKAVTTRQLTATLSDLIEGSEYRFRVKAESPYGMSDPSEESDVMFIPDPKRGILQADVAAVDAAEKRTSRIPVAGNGSAKAKAPAAKSALPAGREPAGAGDGPAAKRRIPVPRLYDSETLTREMNYGSAPTADSGEQREDATMRQQTTQSEQRSPVATSNNDQQPEPQQRRLLKSTKTRAAEVPAGGANRLANTAAETISSESKEPTSYDAEFDSIPPPPLSHSMPELAGSEATVAPKLRRCVSSTEMLYEKAMQRFYKAVELEAEAKTKSAEPTPAAKTNAPAVKRRLGSFGEADLLERRQSLRKRVSVESLNAPLALVAESQPVDRRSPPALARQKPSEPTKDRDLKAEIRETESLQQRRDSLQAQQTPSSSVDYEDDYTESTASSASLTSIDSMEKFKSAIRAISVDRAVEMETYNPMSSRTVSSSSNVRTITQPPPADAFNSDEMIRRSLENTEPEELLSEEENPDDGEQSLRPGQSDDRALSPYRTPTPDQSTISLTRPLPMASAAFVPKPILKRPSIDENAAAAAAAPSIDKLKIKKFDKLDKLIRKAEPPADAGDSADTADSPSEKTTKPERKGLLQMLKKMAAPADKSEPDAGAKQQVSGAVTTKMSAAILAKKKVIEQRRQNSIEENKVAVDHYSHIVEAITVNRRPRTPVYLSADELKRVAERAEAPAPPPVAAAPPPRTPMLGRSNASTPNSSLDGSTKGSQLPVKRASFVRTDSASSEAKAAVALAAAKKDADKRSLFAMKLSKDPKKLAQEAIPSPVPPPAPADSFSRSVSIEEPPPDEPAKRPTLTRGRSVNASTAVGRGASVQRDASKEPAGRKRSGSRTASRSQQSASRSPTGRKRSSLHVARIGIGTPSPVLLVGGHSPDELLDEAERTVRSTMAYVTDVALLLVATGLYVFGDVWLVVPILALLVYRQVRQAISDRLPAMPEWLKRRRPAADADEDGCESQTGDP